jgi:hypothetical protein
MNETTAKKDGFRTVIRLIDAQRKALVEAEARGDIIHAFEAVIKYLHRMPDYQVSRMLGDDSPKPSTLRREAAIKSASTLSLDAIENTLNDDQATRAELEAIAIGRFHVPRGSMRSMGNLELLREKLRTFVQNEQTHATITELARNSR